MAFVCDQPSDPWLVATVLSFRGHFPLTPLVLATGRRHPRFPLFHPLADAWHLPPELQEALLVGCEAFPPFRTVNQLATVSRRDRRTLARQFQSAVGAPARASALTPKKALDWIQLLRAMDLKTPRRSWEGVARALKIDDRTLRRRARDLIGHSLRELAAAGMRTLVHPCEKAWAPLIIPRGNRLAR